MKITIIRIEDWEAIYNNEGESVYQGHNVTKEKLFKVLKDTSAHPKDIEFKSFYTDDKNLVNWAEDHGRLPDTIQEVDKLINPNSFITLGTQN